MAASLAKICAASINKRLKKATSNEGLPGPISWLHRWLVMDVQERAKDLKYIIINVLLHYIIMKNSISTSKCMACFPGILSQPLAVCGSESPEPEVIP